MVHFILVIIYLAFIGLGLPDGILGSAWPSMHIDIGVHVDYAGYIQMIIALGTIISSLFSSRLTKKLGTGKLTFISVLMTALALLGFSYSNQYWMLLLWAIPYGLGAGSVDAALNGYVALNYGSHHMSWLHCMWGLGASFGPYIIGNILALGYPWDTGYRVMGLIQVGLSLTLFLSLPAWRMVREANIRKKAEENQKSNLETSEVSEGGDDLSFTDVLKIPGAKQILLAFFAYIAVETTTGLWIASYLNLSRGFSAIDAAKWASLFYIGITVGRAINGFLTFIFRDKHLIRGGAFLIILGTVLLILAPHPYILLAGILLLGLGCAPVYPSIIHQTPDIFGQDKVYAMVGLQMAAAYTGTLIMPALFGILARSFHTGLLPYYLLLSAILFVLAYELTLRKAGLHR
jgi:fucose permease